LSENGFKIKYNKNSPRPYLFVEEPFIIASFAGYLKYRSNKQNQSNSIFFRGENNDYSDIVPSLFRGKDLSQEVIDSRITAYNKLKTWVPTEFPSSRFRENLTNIFQHYGIKTPSIDLVDNIFIAIWFALYGNKSKYGWVSFIDTSALKISDLRNSHSSLSLRLHTQHGLIGEKKIKKWSPSNISYKQYEVGRIKFPNDQNLLTGRFFSEDYIFPAKSLDNTFKMLKNKKHGLSSKISELEKKYSLTKGDLGAIYPS